MSTGRQMNHQLNAQLFVACKQGTLDEVKNLIARGADINARNAFQQTPLHAAIDKNREEVAIYLIKDELQHGINLNAIDENGYTPLHFAVYPRTPSNITSCLIANGANIHIEDNTFQTPFTLSIENESNPQSKILMRHIMDNNPDIHASYNNLGTLLHCATIMMADELIEQLIVDHGANVNATNDMGNTPLFMLNDGMEDIARLLLNNGASVSISNNEGLTPLAATISNDQFKIVKVFITEYHVNVNDPITGKCLFLEQAIQDGNVELIQMLVEGNAYLDTTTTVTLADDTTPPLYIAALEVLCKHELPEDAESLEDTESLEGAELPEGSESPEDDKVSFVTQILKAALGLDRHVEYSQLEEMICECADKVIEEISQDRPVEALVTKFVSNTIGLLIKPPANRIEISEEEDDTEEEDDVITGAKRTEREDDDAIPEAKISRLDEEQPTALTPLSCAIEAEFALIIQVLVGQVVQSSEFIGDELFINYTL